MQDFEIGFWSLGRVKKKHFHFAFLHLIFFHLYCFPKSPFLPNLKKNSCFIIFIDVWSLTYQKNTMTFFDNHRLYTLH